MADLAGVAHTVRDSSKPIRWVTTFCYNGPTDRFVACGRKNVKGFMECQALITT